MNSTEHLLHQINDTNVSINERARLRCQVAKQLEEIGKYEAAREAMGELWDSVDERPKLQEFDERTTGEVLLRVGTLTGWIGSTKQIEGAQETAKNLISESLAIFESIHEVKKVAEAQIEIGYCYWREGAIDEARVWLKQALSKLDDEDGDLKGVALVRSALFEKVQNRLTDAFHILTSATRLFEASSNDTLKGRFHNEFANVLRRLGVIQNCADYIDRAVIEYTAASFHFEQAGHSRYQGCVENNLALLYLKTNKLAEAHEHLDRAQALFTTIKDVVHLAQVYETRARVMLAEGVNAKSEQMARTAVQLLGKGGEQSLLAEALTTQGISLSRLRRGDQARTALECAINIAEQAGDLESAGTAAITLAEQLAERLSEDELSSILKRADSLLENTENVALLRRHADAYRAFSMIHIDWPTPLDKSVHRFEARMIRRALEEANGVIAQAARLLVLTHQNLHNILNNRHNNLRKLAKALKARKRQTSLNNDVTGALINDTRSEVATVRILHVEDNRVIAETVRETLEMEGWDVETCADGTVGLKKILSDAHYDLLLLDYDLPGVSGIELVRHARGAAHRQETPIIVLSAALGEAEAREAGANEFLHKPEDIRSLVQTISGLLSSAEDQET